MKRFYKIFIILLLLIICVYLLTGCKEKNIGNNVFNVETLENAKGNINTIYLDSTTINNQYPVVIEFETSDD